MNRRTLAERLDDWMNPIVVKELRQAVQSKLVVGALMLFLALQIIILGSVLLSWEMRARADQIDFGAGRQLFLILQGIMLGTCMLVPAYVGGRLGSERSDVNTDLLFISTLKPRQIVFGKFLSGAVLILLVLSACTPFMTFTYLLRGIDIPTILFIVATDFVLALAGTAATIFLAVVQVPRPVRGALGLSSLGGLFALFMGGMGLSVAMLSEGLLSSLDTWEFWGPVLFALGMIVGGAGLLFSWSIALLSPPAANRAYAVRLYLLCFLTVTGIASYFLSDVLKNYGPVSVWVFCASMLCCLQLFISVNERERQGPRVARTIPRNPLMRLPAFLLYSGAAGGVIFSTLLLLASVGVGLLILAVRGDLEIHLAAYHGAAGPALHAGSGWLFPELLHEILRFVVVAGLFTWSYCLSGVFVRTVILRNRVRAEFTWFVVLLLVGFGTVGPFLIFYFSGGRYSPRSFDRNWTLTNPFVVLEQATSVRYRYGDLLDFYAMPFLACWAAAAAIMNIGWLLTQFRRFSPTAPSPRAERDAVRMVLAETRVSA